MSIKSVFVGIRLWAAGKNLITGSTWQKQFGKLQEEVNEAKEAMELQDLAKVKDELGDCGVVLTLQPLDSPQSSDHVAQPAA